MKKLILAIYVLVVTAFSIHIITEQPSKFVPKPIPQQAPLEIPFQKSETIPVAPPPKKTEKAQQVYLIAFRGLGGAMEEVELRAWAKRNNYILKIYHHSQLDKAMTFVLSLPKKANVEILGFSKGAETAYELARDTDEVAYRRMLTVGTYHTVTTSFATNRRPPLPNVRKHWNFVESHQQPKNFKKNPINISLGVVSHYKALSKTLNILENNPKYNG